LCLRCRQTGSDCFIVQFHVHFSNAALAHVSVCVSVRKGSNLKPAWRKHAAIN
jgi:hypothetical protein